MYDKYGYYREYPPRTPTPEDLELLIEARARRARNQAIGCSMMAFGCAFFVDAGQHFSASLESIPAYFALVVIIAGVVLAIRPEDVDPSGEEREWRRRKALLDEQASKRLSADAAPSVHSSEATEPEVRDVFARTAADTLRHARDWITARQAEAASAEDVSETFDLAEDRATALDQEIADAVLRGASASAVAPLSAARDLYRAYSDSRPGKVPPYPDDVPF